jgi:hypothetical protein
MKDLLQYDVPVIERQIDIVYVLRDGRTILQKEIAPHAHLFTWLDHNQIEHMAMELKPQTDEHRKSIIAVFETGQIRTYPNVSPNFTNYGLLNKSSL